MDGYNHSKIETAPGFRSKHERIAAEIGSGIKTGKFIDRLPGREELAERFQVNFKTIGKALGILERDRLVVPRRGLGMFLHPRLKGQVISECYLVFPGHKALTDIGNEGRQVTLCILEEILNSAHEFHVEVKLLPISPLNNTEINWTLLTHLRSGDNVIFVGLQYWNVIQELSQRGCRCLVLSSHPATDGLASDGMSLMTFDVDYLDLVGMMPNYCMQYGFRHLAVVHTESLVYDRIFLTIFKRFIAECGRRGIAFATQDIVAVSAADGSLADFCAQTVRRKPATDVIFTLTNECAQQVRNMLDERFPETRHSIRIVCFDHCHTWRKNLLDIDALRKPLDDMVRHLMEVVCGKRPFEIRDVVFPFRLEPARAEDDRRTGRASEMSEEWNKASIGSAKKGDKKNESGKRTSG